MRKYKIIKINKAVNIILILIFSFFLFTPIVYGSNELFKQSTNYEKIPVSKITKQIEISPGSDYYIKFNSEDLILEDKIVEPYANGLSDKVVSAIVKSPTWIRQDLSRQFFTIENPEEYADIILNAPKNYIDEIAFSFAHSPVDRIPPSKLIYDNVEILYENDRWISYADIIDYDEGDGNYYSTVKYKVIENGEEKYFEYPSDIYYWYIVHPGTCGEEIKYVYEKFWRDYVFNHNDIGYPLLKEKLSGIEYLWDCMSYSQPGNRLWKWSMENHPTAIEAISYWIGKTVPYEAMGDRPGQPNIIAHEHNGYCGELQRIAVAAQRTALIASIGACNIGEDHVWREFYERGWHQNDNWWTDSGGNVNQPDTYQYGWGKYMSAVYASRGDDTIYDVTSTYIHPEDRTTIKFVVRDNYLKPIDGARVTVTVQGIKDISWIKYSILQKMAEIWDKIPDLIKGRILQTIYDKIYDRIDESDDIIDGLTITTWNYTDMNGECTFKLGKNHKYLFVIQHGENLRKPWQLAKNNAIRVFNNTRDKIFNVLFVDFSRRITNNIDYEMPTGEVSFDVSFNTSYYQLQKSIISNGFGMYQFDGVIDCFFVDEENFENYNNNRLFKSYNYMESNQGNFKIDAENKNWYIVFRNHAKHTSIVLDCTIDVKTDYNSDRICIVTPDTSLFDKPSYNIGDIVNFSGLATCDFILTINDEDIDISPIDCKWNYLYDSSNLIPGDYSVKATCSDITDEITISLIDADIPNLEIVTPYFGEIVEVSNLLIAGNSFDNFDIDKVEIAIDDSDFLVANGTNNWEISYDISSLDIGDHYIFARATDLSGNMETSQISFVLNESGHTWGPEINALYHTPQNPTNVSNIIIFSNITKNSPFEINSVKIFYNDGLEIKSYDMYEYANNPIQNRHEEDPLINESNDPIYGIELGQFDLGTIINYWIVCNDTAHNYQISDVKSIEII